MEVWTQGHKAFVARLRQQEVDVKETRREMYTQGTALREAVHKLRSQAPWKHASSNVELRQKSPAGVPPVEHCMALRNMLRVAGYHMGVKQVRTDWLECHLHMCNPYSEEDDACFASKS